MITTKNETEDLRLCNTKNCETLFKQTHRKAEETFQFYLTKQTETFLFKPPFQIEGSWMVVLTNLGVYNSIYNITEENNKFELYTDHLDSFHLRIKRQDSRSAWSFSYLTRGSTT